MQFDNAKKIPKAVAVIDCDPSSANSTKKSLSGAGVKQIDVFTDPESGFKAIRTGVYSGAVIDWRLNNSTSGIAMLSRIRRVPDLVYLPVIIAALGIRKEEMRFLHDFQCTRILEKPLIPQKFSPSLKELTEETLWYRQNEAEIANAFNVASMDASMAKMAMARLLNSAPHSAPLAMLAAKHLISHNFFDPACEIIDNTLKKDVNFLPALSLKSKLYAKMGRFQESLELLKSAQKISPQNIDRLALMGEVEISLRNPEGAIESFRKALDLDPSDFKSKVGVVVAKNLSKIVELQVQAAGEELSLARIINNLGVSLSKSGHYEKALKYFLMSFSFVGTKDLQTKVSFNIGLGFKKWNKLPQAKFWLQKSLDLSDGTYPKAKQNLIGLESVKSQAGFTDEEPVVRGISKSNAALSRPLPPTTKENVELAKHEKKKSSKVTPFIDPDFEEESVAPVLAGTGPTTANRSQAFDAMINDIDKLAEDEMDFAFDDVI